MFATSENIVDIVSALAKAQAEVVSAKKDATNTYIGGRYATLAAVVDACRAPLAKNGLAVVQCPAIDLDGQVVTLTTRLYHSTGQWIECVLKAPGTMLGKDGKTKFDVQSLGSAITYLRRYALSAMVGVAPDDDDDGNAASGSGSRGSDRGNDRSYDRGQRRDDQNQRRDQRDERRQVQSAPRGGDAPRDARAQDNAAPADGKAPQATGTKEWTRGDWIAWLVKNGWGHRPSLEAMEDGALKALIGQAKAKIKADKAAADNSGQEGQAAQPAAEGAPT